MQKRLSGKRILITRASRQLHELSERLSQEGATVLEVPTIEIVSLQEGILDLKKAIDQIQDYRWLVLTSVNSVSILQDALTDRNQDWNAFISLDIACIGTSTAKKVKDYGGRVALVPPHFQAESLTEELLKKNIRGQKILLPRAAGSREILPNLLTEAGATVDEIYIYRAEVPASRGSELERILSEQQIDFITFTSSSTVRNFFELVGGPNETMRQIRIACIGPITAATLKEYGFDADVVAEEFTLDGLVEAIVSATRAPSGHRS